ncbi:MAG: retropepsin-like domain-containing protein [Myxococcales bacterium]|nr:retropepsin-like domain-containing protein [Myxococcales bacterium]
MKRALAVTLCVCGVSLALLPLFTLVGLGVHRHAAPWAIGASAMLLVFAPSLAMATAAPRERSLIYGAGQFSWSLALFLMLPIYFPGERRSAVATGLAVTGFGASSSDLPERIADSLPEEPEVARPEVAEASTLTAAPLPPSTVPLSDDQIALPYEGEGRRMSVPVIFENQGIELELDMMFDTGATYTTLSHETLASLGIHPTDADPVIRLHTANGERLAQVMLVDAVWLGDLPIEGVAIATCDDCANADTAGLLGLNVAGGFNLSIDADRREVVFTRREHVDRKIDIKPFVDLAASFTRFPGGRVEVRVRLDNGSRRPILSAITSIQCGTERWKVQLAELVPGEEGTVRQRLPRHPVCEQYQIALHEALW